MLVGIIIISTLISSFAHGENAYDKKLEESIIKVKNLFNISDGYDKFTSHVNSYNGNTNFYLNWSDSKGKLNSINVNISLEGYIISYDSYPSVYKEPSTKLPVYTKEEAQRLAMDFIAKVDPTILDFIKLTPQEYPISSTDEYYYFNFTRHVNDIPFYQNSVSININKYSGEISYYYSNWDRKLEFPSPEKIITIDKGQEAFKKEIGLKPMYKSSSYYRPFDMKDELNHYLAYSILGANRGIDAFTGEKVNLDYYGPYFGMTESAKAMDTGMEGGLTPEEQASVDKLSGLLDESVAEKKARELLNIDDSYKVNSKNLYNNYKNPDEYNWNIYFFKEVSKDKSLYMDIGLDARTGELLNFYKSIDYNPDAKPKISKDKALDIAKEYIKKIQPKKLTEIELMEDIYQEDSLVTYNFSFIRKSDEIYVENDRIYIAVDGISGEVYSYNLDWFKGDLPSKEKLIEAEKAYEVLWNKIGFELMYIKIYDYTKPENENFEIKLVYGLNQNKPVIISGTTGELLDYSGKPYKEIKPINYIDIDTSYAKDKIKTLGEYGIGFEGEEFKPKDKIKQKDLIYLLWKSMNQYRYDSMDEEKIYNEFITQGYMKEEEKAPDNIVTKEEATKYIVRMMKMEKVAEVDGIFKEIFLDEKDISKGLKGYMTIAYGLNIIQGDGTGKIKPKYELKREDAATMIYNYLFN